MTPRRSFVGTLATGRWSGRALPRRLVGLVLVILFALLTLFPQRYRALASLTPTDPTTLGLGGALGQLGAFTSVFGNQAAVEIGLKVARSVDVRTIVIRRTDLVHRLHFSSPIAADRWLQSKVDIRALRGGIIQIECKSPDPDLALTLVSAFADGMRVRLAEISRTQTAYKRNVLENLVANAGDRLDRAQAAYDAFRRQTRYSAPGSAIGNIGERVPVLQQELKVKEVELKAARAFATDENMTVRQILVEIDALRAQLAEAESLNASDPNSVNRVVTQSTQVQRLERELRIARALYDSYNRYLEGTSVEDLASTGNVRTLEPPFIDSARQLNPLPLACLMLTVLLWGAIEFYLMRPPVGAFRGVARPVE